MPKLKYYSIFQYLGLTILYIYIYYNIFNMKLHTHTYMCIHKIRFPIHNFDACTQKNWMFINVFLLRFKSFPLYNIHRIQNLSSCHGQCPSFMLFSNLYICIHMHEWVNKLICKRIDLNSGDFGLEFYSGLNFFYYCNKIKRFIFFIFFKYIYTVRLGDHFFT